MASPLVVLAVLLHRLHCNHRSRTSMPPTQFRRGIQNVHTRSNFPLASSHQNRRVVADKIANEVYAAHYSERRIARIAIGTLAGVSLVLAVAVVQVVQSSHTHALRSHRRCRPRAGYSIQRFELQPTRGRDSHVSHGLGQLPAHNQSRDHREEVPHELLLPVVPACLPAHQHGQQQPPHDSGGRRTDRTERRAGKQRHHYVDDSGAYLGSGCVARNGSDDVRPHLLAPATTQKPRTEHWMASVTYYINPAQVSDHAKTNPQYETINPLGVTITEFHENRVSVDQTPGRHHVSPGGKTMSREMVGRRCCRSSRMSYRRSFSIQRLAIS